MPIRPFQFVTVNPDALDDPSLLGMEIEPSPTGWSDAKAALKRIYGFTRPSFELSFSEDVLVGEVDDRVVIIGEMLPRGGMVPMHESKEEVAEAVYGNSFAHQTDRVNAYVNIFKNGEPAGWDVWPDFGLVFYSCPAPQ